jgi:phosphatidylserine/phosphatidylglycerophosphate/cardiolipin synthase-like enzyme
MKKTIIFLMTAMISLQFTFAQVGSTPTWPMNGKIRVYFTRKVNTTVASSASNDAVYLDNCINDTLAAYIGRAKTSIDICCYDASSDSPMTTVMNAVNAAYERGVTVRWIYDSSETDNQTELANLHAGIYKLASPVANSTYGTEYIMHNKFMIIDAASSTNATVWTGSPDWGTYQFNYCFNNVVILQDQTLAQAYTTQFNQMWGSTTAVYNKSNSKFGIKKTASTTTSFTIGGSTVELYFSPMDATQTHIIDAINTANTDLYFGIYTFSTTSLSAPIITQHSDGILCAGIVDSYSNGNTCVTNLSSALTSTYFKIYTEDNDTIYHNKFCIIDPSNPNSDPQVVTGSHNWSTGANTENDENDLIIHNAAVANMYYQEFYANFQQVGGEPLPIITGINEFNPTNGDVYIYPNPALEGSPVYLNINPSLNVKNARMLIYDALGNKLNEITHLTSHQNAINCGIHTKGMYFYQLYDDGKTISTGKFIYQ